MARRRSGGTVSYSTTVDVDVDVEVDEIIEEIDTNVLIKELRSRGQRETLAHSFFMEPPFVESDRQQAFEAAIAGDSQRLLSIVCRALEIDRARPWPESLDVLPRCITTRRPLVL